MTEDDLKQFREMGKIVVPFLSVWVATQLVAARYSHPQGQPVSEEWRKRVIVESLQDAALILDVI